MLTSIIYWLNLCFLINLIVIIQANNEPICNVVINEINSDVAQKLEVKEFIEIKQVCPDNAIKFESLNGYKIIIIDHKKNGQPIIHTIINLQKYVINENDFFTIGGTEVKEASLNIPSDDIMFRHFYETKQLNNFIPNCNDLPCGIALLFDPSNFPQLKLSMDNHYLVIDIFLKIIIKSSLKDLIVYGRRAKTRRCDIFEFLKPEFINENYILRDYDEQSGDDLSLNRCTVSTLPYLHGFFQLGTPTPSEENDCSISVLVAEQSILDITPPIQTLIQNRVPETCQSEIPPNVYESIQTNLVVDLIQKNKKRQKLESCSNMLKEMNANNDREDVVIANERISNMGFDVSSEWETTKYFDSNWIKFMKTKLKGLMPIFLLSGNNYIQSWFMFRPNNIDPLKSRYLCRLCAEYFDVMLLNGRARSTMANKDGFEVSSQYKNNYDIIKKHYSSISHQAVVGQLIKLDKEKLIGTFNEIQRKSEISKQAYAATARMIRTVYAEIRANVAFKNHRIFVDLQKTHGVDLGYMWANRHGATSMTETISREMNNRLIKHIKSQNNPFSVIIDTSEDIMKNHYLSVMIQAIELSRPVVYFYKLIQLSSSETGLGIFTSLYNQLVKDNLINDFKNNLIGFVSDGASVMTSEKVGVVAQVKKTFGQKIVAIRCMAHRMQLVAGHAMKSFDYFTDFEKNINDLHNFYFGHSHKRPIQLREMAEELDLIIYKLDYIYQVRWLASEVKALRKVQNMWFLLVSNLDKISTDLSEKAITRTKANSLLKTIKDKNFLMILHFMIDILDFLNVYSLEFQRTGGTMIGKSYLVEKMIKGIETFQITFGSNVVEFLSSIKCPNQASVNYPCSLQDFESNSVIWKDISIVPSVAPLLSTLRKVFLDKILEEISSMFPDIELKNFNIFLPNNIPRNPAEFSTYGLNELKELHSFFKWDFTLDLLQSDWDTLLNNMFSNQDVWCSVQNLPPNLFWSEYLKLDIWTPRTLKLIYTGLVLPVGSSDVERSFSFLNIIKSRHRNSITPHMLDNLIRIKMNGPIEISKFRAVEYAEAWISEGHNPVDEKSRRVEKEVPFDEDNPDFVYLDRSALF